MNIDILLFIGLLVISLLRERDKTPKAGAIIISTILALVCTATKLYFVIGLCSWLLAARLAGDAKPKFDLPVCIAAIGGLSTAIPWLASGDKFATPQLGLFSHGLVFKTSEGTISASATLVSTGFLIIGIYLASRNRGLQKILRNYGRDIKTSRTGRTKTCMACGGLATWIGCYMLASNWDYRLVFTFPWIIMIAHIMQTSSFESQKRQTSWLLLTILCTAAIQILSPLAYIWISSVPGETMSLRDWILNPSGLFLRHIASAAITLSDLVLLPFFAGSSLIACWSVYQEHRENFGDRRSLQAVRPAGLQDPRPPRNL
jgi:hypothetical protein